MSTTTNQSLNSNPTLPPRGQTPQSFQHRQSLSQFQPSSMYAQKDQGRSNSPIHSQLPFQQQNYTSNSTPTREPNSRYKNQNYLQNQTEQIHSYDQPVYKPQPQHAAHIKAQVNPYGHMNSRPSMDHSSVHLLSKMEDDSIPKSSNYVSQPGPSNPYQPSKYPQNPYSSNSSQSPLNSVNSQRESINGYRPSMDFTSQLTSMDKTAPSNRLDDANESYQRNVALRRNSKLVSGESPYSIKQVGFWCLTVRKPVLRRFSPRDRNKPEFLGTCIERWGKKPVFRIVA